MTTDDQPTLTSLMSEDGLALLAAKGDGLLRSIGLEVIQEVVFDVLCGRNIRSATESLTRRRIAILNLELLQLFVNGKQLDPSFAEKLPYLASSILHNKSTKSDRLLASWMLGLTGKGIQNILRSDRSLIPEYRDIYVETCQGVVKQFDETYGALKGVLDFGDKNAVTIDTLFILYLMNAIGAQTLTTRGSEKSLYGKFFERLVLGSVLYILGFQYTEGKLDTAERIFWLASKSEAERESDATLLYAFGQGVRFDIGFIGSGNTEISLDKVSRYRRSVEIGNRHWFMGTIIIVDRIGSRSGIVQKAREIDGKIVQMSGSYWVRTIASELRQILGYQHEILDVEDAEIEDYIHTRLEDVPVLSFFKQNTSKKE
jgi:hypothetical protein